VLERLPRAEIGRERKDADHLGSTDRPHSRRGHRGDSPAVVGGHIATLYRGRLEWAVKILAA
jgi:hypothetical protein